MRQEGIQVTFKIPIKFDEPDGNGVIYTRDSVEKSLESYRKAPILFTTSKVNEVKVIGAVNDEPAILDCELCEDGNHRYYINVNGILRAGGSCEECFPINNTVKEYTVTAVGICDE